jgi:hypothetical protein
MRHEGLGKCQPGTDSAILASLQGDRITAEPDPTTVKAVFVERLPALITFKVPLLMSVGPL